MKHKEFYPGMGQAVAERTILRKKDSGEWETWGDVAKRVSLGNSLLCKTKEEQQEEYEKLTKYISKAALLMSGRHLQHGDETQPKRNQEVMTNCSTSSSSFLLFYLLMNGSGVGRCYDDDLMIVNWDHAPNLRCVLDERHPDFDYVAHESVRDAKHKYGKNKDVLWHVVKDTREGWAKAVEIYEVAAFEKIHKDKLLILDFSEVRSKGTPIKGMQNRPASGPVPLMHAFGKVASLKGSCNEPWRQAMYVDHYFAECVLVGGARRAARIACKTWKDKSVIDFIQVKRPIEYFGKTFEEIKNIKQGSFLWSSNNSVLVDDCFWNYVENEGESCELAQHARNVFKCLAEASYGDGTGEPGIINQNKLHQDSKGMHDCYNSGNYVGSEKYQVEEESHLFLQKIARKVMKKKNYMIVNPCVTGDTWVMTENGPKQVLDLIDVSFKAMVNGKSYPSYGFFKTGNKEVYEIKTKSGFSLKATADHKILTQNNNWIETSNLKKGTKLCLNNNKSHSWEGTGVPVEFNFDEDISKLEYTSSEFYKEVIEKIYEDYGYEINNNFFLSNIRSEFIPVIQRMLLRLGIFSFSKNGHICVLDKNGLDFKSIIIDNKNVKNDENYHYDEVLSVTKIGNQDVYDCVVDEVHCFDANGIIAHNCGEISLNMLGGFCVIADTVPLFADSLDEAEDVFRATTRALIRVNMMDSIYSKEVKRTNRIGVGITGVHEFAWKFFKFNFYDLIDEKKSIDFWMTLARFNRAVREESESYSKKCGVNPPHTLTTIKPAGTTSKLFGLTEGWHLPAMDFYLRWVQFSKDDPLVKDYANSGYPTRELKSYKNTMIVGFPTAPLISTMGLNNLVLASQATPEQQYTWLMLGEKYWIEGVDEKGKPLSSKGNQISYTLKYKYDSVSFEKFCNTLKKYQSKIKCCSVMPQEESSSYEYLPEEIISKEKYDSLMSNIKLKISEDIGKEHIDCSSGACPVDFKEK